MVDQEPRAYSIRAFCAANGISRSQVYNEIKAGRLKRVKLGRKTLITREANDDWLRLLEAESA